MATTITPEYVRGYEDRCAREREAAVAVRAAMDATPPDLETLKKYAAMMFDSSCGADQKFLRCRCAYCDARRFLEENGGS